MPQGSTAFQMMEDSLFSLKSLNTSWLDFSPNSLLTNLILAFLCGLGLFFLIHPFLKNNPPYPSPKKNKSIRELQKEPRPRRRNRKKSGALKACRDCLYELDETRKLMLLLQSYQKKQPIETNKLHQLVYQDPKAVPARAKLPSRKWVEDTVQLIPPKVSTTPLTEHPPTLASTLSAAAQEEQSDLERIPMGIKSKSSAPGNACVASPVPTMSDLAYSRHPSLLLSWWWERAKALFSLTSSPYQSQQQHLPHHLPQVSFYGGPTHWQVETGNPSFVNLHVQKLLEILIIKRVALSIWKGTQKDGSCPQQVSLDHHLNALTEMLKSLHAEPHPTIPTPFCNTKDKGQQLPRAQQLSYPSVLGDIIQQTFSQFFWGLPSLHSESLVATALVPWSVNQLHASSVLFNGTSNSMPVLTRPLTPQISQTLPLHRSTAQLQLVTGKLPQSQATPLPPVQTQVHLTPTQTTELPNSPSQISHYETSSTLEKIMKQSPILTETEPLEDSKLQKHVEKGVPLVPLVQLVDPICYLRSLEWDGGNKLSQSSHWIYVERALKVHLDKKVEQIRRGLIPVSIRRSWLMANQDASNASLHAEARNLGPFKWQDTNKSTYTQEELKGHNIQLRVRQKWGLNLQVTQSRNHKPLEIQHCPLP